MSDRNALVNFNNGYFSQIFCTASEITSWYIVTMKPTPMQKKIAADDDNDDILLNLY